MINNYDKVQTKGRLGLIKDTEEIIASAELMISFFDSVAEQLWWEKLLKDFSVIILCSDSSPELLLSLLIWIIS